MQNKPETLTVAYIEYEIVAAALIIPGKKASCLIVFVAPQYRQKGIEQSVVQYGENYMKHTEGRFAISELPVRLYIDEDY